MRESSPSHRMVSLAKKEATEWRPELPGLVPTRTSRRRTIPFLTILLHRTYAEVWCQVLRRGCMEFDFESGPVDYLRTHPPIDSCLLPPPLVQSQERKMFGSKAPQGAQYYCRGCGEKLPPDCHAQFHPACLKADKRRRTQERRQLEHERFLACSPGKNVLAAAPPNSKISSTAGVKLHRPILDTQGRVVTSLKQRRRSLTLVPAQRGRSLR